MEWTESEKELRKKSQYHMLEENVESTWGIRRFCFNIMMPTYVCKACICMSWAECWHGNEISLRLFIKLKWNFLERIFFVEKFKAALGYIFAKLMLQNLMVFWFFICYFFLVGVVKYLLFENREDVIEK